MRKLIIKAHPSKMSFTQKISDTIENACKDKGNEIEVIDLYDDEWQMPFLRFTMPSEIEVPENAKLIQEKITKADELIFVFPMWWMGPPAILKNFFDTVLSSGFAFKYVKGKNLPEKLLTTKKARVYMTSDGPNLVYKMLLTPFKTVIKFGTLEFCGIKVTEFKLFGGMRKKTETERENILNDLYKKEKGI